MSRVSSAFYGTGIPFSSFQSPINVNGTQTVKNYFDNAKGLLLMGKLGVHGDIIRVSNVSKR